MKTSDLLSPPDVMIDVRASNKPLLLQEFAAKAAASLGVPVDHVAPYLLKREALGSTGIGKGVAIPHARLPSLQRPFGILAKLRQPIEFDPSTGSRSTSSSFSCCLRPRRMKRLAHSHWWPGP